MEETGREMEAGFPEAFICRMKEWLKEEYPLFLASYQQCRAQGLRLNWLKGEREELERVCRTWFDLEPVPWAEGGFYYGQGERPGKHPFHEAGIYYIQEPSAMAVVEALEVKPGEIVLDLCAAPGGKSTQIAAHLKGTGLLVSNEIHPARAKILSQNIERMGAANVAVLNHDAKVLAAWLPGFFDKIVVDAPCSGEGMFRKEFEARTEWKPDSPRQCSLRQQEILEYAACMLKPGGRLVYSTCTFAPEENEGTIKAFLQRHQEFFIDEAIKTKMGFSQFGKGRPDWILAEGEKEGQLSGGSQKLESTFRLWPHQIRGEGHYLAVLGKGDNSEIKEQAGGIAGIVQKEDMALENRIGKYKGKNKEAKRTDGKKEKGVLWAGSREEETVFAQFCQEVFVTGDWRREKEAGKRAKYIWFGEQIYSVPVELPDISGKKVLRPGLHLGGFKKNRFEPSHALALYLKKEQVKQWINLYSRGEHVIRYLKGESLQEGDGLRIIGPKTSGWVLVTVDGYSLGWAKLAGGRLKNHYPKGLRWTS